MRRLPSVLGAFLLLTLPAFADHGRILPGKPISTPPKIDGVLNAEEWQEAATSTSFVHVATGEKTAWDCTIYAAYDATNIYFAFFNPDPDPSQIRATEYRRNAQLQGNDYNIILINPFKTYQGRDANQFNIGAGGGMQAQFAGGRSSKREWQGDWEARSRITDNGWECEVRIPWRTLRLPGTGNRDIEINFARFIPRANIGISWCDIGENERMDYNGTWQDVAIPAVSGHRELLALPYQIVGWDGEKKRSIIDSGLDLRYDISSQVTSLASINPDFRNVEGSVLSLSFSRFERLAQEKRPFFVEGQNEFFLGGMSASLFSPQRIGQFDVGAKAFGKLSDKDSFGALFTNRVGHETSGVFRFHRTWGDQGGVTLGTVQWDDPDSGVRNSASEFLVVQQGPRWGADLVYDQTEDRQAGTGKRFDADILYRDQHSFASFGWQEITTGFMPRIGFAPRRGYKGYNAYYQYNRQFTKGAWSEVRWESFFQDFRQEHSPDTYLKSAYMFLSGTTRSSLDIDLQFNFENFLGSEARFWTIDFNFPENDPYHNYDINYTVGDVDGTKYSLLGAFANYRFNNRVTVSPALQFEKFGSTTTEQHILGISYEIDKDQSVGGRAVIRDKSTNWYMAYRKSGNLGAEYYLIVGDPNADKFQMRIILKAVFPVNWRF